MKKPKPTKSPAAMPTNPPPAVQTVFHGPRSKPLRSLVGTARLRALLNLSDRVELETLAEEAAQEIERLRNVDRSPRRLPTYGLDGW